MTDAPRICIYGAGAVGGLIGARLADAGCTVAAVARGATLAALQEHGLRVSEAGRQITARVTAAEDPAALGPQDFLVIAVKAPALPGIARRVAPLLGPETAVVTAMNGVPWWFFANRTDALAGRALTAIDPDGSVAAAMPADRAIGCVVHLTAALSAPGVVQHGFGHRLIVGEADHRRTPRLARLQDWLTRAGFETEASPDIQRDIWIKLWGNLSVNPVSLLTEATVDRIIDDPLVYDLCRRMMEETAAVGLAIGIPVTLSVEERIGMARKLGAFKTSMLQDLERRTPVEIDALLTVTRDIGGMVGVATPFIDAVLGLSRLRAAGLGIYRPATSA